jgi:hypothetical protein
LKASEIEDVMSFFAPDSVLDTSGGGLRRPVDSTGWVEFRDARVMFWADGLIERVTTFLDIHEALAAAERLAQERG